MKDPKDLPPDFTDLRRRAEEAIADEGISPEELAPDQAARLIHELRVHQIELEMQNDELRRSQAELEESRSKYADLYDFAPVGYLTLDKAGKIVEANLTAATLLGVERSKLLNRFFPHFLVEADRRAFRQLLNNGLNLKERRGEVHLQDGGGNVRVMLLDILFLADAEGQDRRRVSLTDITELKHTQEELRLHQEDLEELVAQRTAELIETNEKLREVNDNLKALFTAAPLAIAEFDAEGKVIKINPACERMYGWSQEEVQGRLPLSIPKDSPEESLALLQRVLGGESVAGVEIKAQRKDGSLFDASVFGAPLWDAHGKLRGFVGLAEDITQRKKLAEDVRTQAQVLKNMAEGVNVTDQHGQIIYTNPAFDAMFGYEAGELAGKQSNVLNFYPPEENLTLVKEILSRVNATGLWAGEFRNCKKNGKPFFTSARISTVEVGGKKLYISVQEDITRRKKTREVLQRQAELLDLAHDAILVRDTRGRITYWNQGAAHHYGWSREAAMGRISHQLLKTVFPQPLLAIERHLLEHGFWEGELTHTTQQGKEVVINSRWTAKRDETGHIVAILEINQDITVQKQIEEEVQRLASFPLLNPNPVLEVDEDGHITYANPAARHAVEQLRLAEGAKAFVPPDLKEKFAAVRQGCPRQYTFDLSFKGKAYAVNLTFPHDLPAARLYALDITERQLSEEARRESEERYRSLVNLSPDSIMVHTKGKYIFVNPAGLELFGAARPEDLIGRRVLELVHPESQKNVRRRLKAGERLDIREVKILRLDGRPVEVEVAATPITYGGQPAVQVMLRDITERKAAEEALARSQAEFAAIFQSISDGIVFTDTQRRIAMVNPAAEDLFGYSPEEMQGRLTDFLYASQEDFKEQGRQRYHNQSEQSARVYEITYRRKDGSVFPAEARGGQVKNAQGQVLGFVSINRDVTECKQADEVLRESENRFRKVFENAAMGIAITDWEGGFQQCNPAYCIMLGYTEEELRRLTFPALIHPEDWDANVKEIHLLKAGKIPYFELENRYVHKDSRVVWVHKFVSVLPDITGKPAHLMALVTDITARKQAEETVRESEARFRSLFDSMTEGVALHQIIYDEPGTPVDYRILATNPAFTVHTGLAAEQIRGRLASEAYGAGEAPYLETYARVAHIGHPAVFETYFPPLERHFSVSVTSPKEGHFFTVFEDITERKQAEAALKESEARYRAIGELIPFGIWTAAPDGGWEYISKSFLKMTGRTLEECQGLNWVNLLPQEDIKPTLDAWQQCREIGNFWDHELKIRSKDGAWRTVISRGLPLADSQGRITSWVGLNLDISERKDMEEALSRAYDQMEERVEKRTAALRLVNEQLRQEIEERQEIEDRLQDSEARFTAFMEHLPGLAVMRDMEGRYLFATRAWEETMGLAPKAWRGKTLAELWTPERTAFLQKSDFEIISTGEPTEEVEVQVLSDGPHHFLTKRFPILGNDGLPYMVGAISIDITARQRAEQQVAETGRLYQVLSQVNEAIMRGRDQQSLFDQVCRILVEEGQFRLAWVGLTDPETQTVRVAAKYSVEEGYLDNLAISLKGGPRSKGPTGTAIRDNRSDVCNDLVTDPRMKPWRLEALAKGYGSSGAFPLHLGAEVVGAIMLYAPRPQFFTDKEITLLTSLADNLSFALESLDREDKRRRAEEEIRKQAALLDLAHDAIIVGDPGSKIVFWSRGAEETYGWRKAQALGAVTHDLLKTKFPSSKEDVDRELLQKGAWEGELLHTRADGNVITLASRQVLQKDDQGKPVAILEINRDITERHLAEEALAEQAMLVQDLYNKAPCGYHSLDSEGYFAQVNDTELAWLGYAREELVGRLRFSDLMTPDSRKLFEEIFPGFRARGWVKDLEYELIRKDGTILPVLLSATTVTDEAGNYLLSRSTMFDITGRKKADQALQESEKRLRYLAEQLLNAQENERKRLASELHDELGHALLALKLNLSSIEKKLLPEQQVIKEEVRAQLGYINEVIQDVRRLYHDLSPGDLEDLGLTKALGTLINDFAGHFPQVNWQVDLADMVGLFSLPVQTIIYRIIQEALTNIGKHAHPTIVTIFSKKENQQMHFVVRDNGIGFNIQELSSRDTARGLGLAAMQERLKMVGGSFEIQSREQEGTKLSFSIPVLPEGGKQ